MIGGIGFGATGRPEIPKEIPGGGSGFQREKLVAQTQERDCSLAQEKVARSSIEAGLAK